MTSLSRASTLTPCSSPAPPGIPVQPDHFYGTENVQLPPSPNSDGKTYLDPADDPLAHRGIPVFKPTMEDFQDFEEYMNRVECWGMRSGIVKIIPPKEWTDSLPPLKEQLANVKIKTPIEQHMLGSGGLFRQENMEKRKLMSVREWAELCIKDEFRAPGVHDVGISSRGANVPTPRPPRVSRRTKQKSETVKAESTGPASNVITVKEEPTEDSHSLSEERTAQAIVTPPHSGVAPPSPAPTTTTSKSRKTKKKQPPVKQEPKPRPKRVNQTREAREASLADRAARDRAFLEVFDPHQEWLPPNTKATDYTPEFCQTLERHYWRNCGLGKPAWYGADTQGSLFTDETTSWNVAHLKSALTRLLPSSSQGLPGVNTPYLYFGMWRATFAWHVEDMDLFSINYIHFGAPKFWYAVPQGRANALEQIMRGYFPKDTSQCPQFLRHKSFLASPSLLAKDSCRPNHMVQQAGEFVITYPRGYHAGFNLGFNCAESVNFALDSWLELGRKAKACECISDSVRIDVDELLRERAEEQDLPPPSLEEPPLAKASKRSSGKKQIVKQEVQEENLPPMQPKAPSRKRKSDASEEGPKPKKIKTKASSKASTSVAGPSTSTGRSTSKPLPKVSVTLKLGPRPTEPESFPCCLCVSTSEEGLLRVQDPPVKKDAIEGASHPKVWMAHELCAKIVPETWVDDLLLPHGGSERVVYGVDAIVKDRWNLKCSACTKSRMKGHGAPVQCTKGKCPKAFHVNCAKEGHTQGIVFSVVRDVEKEVVLYTTPPPTAAACASANMYEMQAESDPSTFTGDPADFYAMAVDGQLVVPAEHHNSSPADETTVLKIIKKLEVQILCTQHNPAVAAQKRASKQDKIRQDLLALPSMARIKIRVSAGVFEVSLIRVIEETGSVEVLWDRGTKREFKWGSVVFGTTDGPVQQKPSDMLAYAEQEQIHLQHQQQHQQQERPPSVLPVNTFPSVSAATAQRHSYNQTSYAPIAPAPSPSATSLNRASSSSSTTSNTTQPAMNLNYQAYGNRTAYALPARTGSYDYWAYASAAAAAQYNSQAYGYPYSGYYASAGTSMGAVGSKHYNPYAYGQAYAASSSAHAQAYRVGAGAGQQLNWQQPYQPPRLEPQSQVQPQQQIQGLTVAQGSSLGVAAGRTNSEPGHAPEISQAPGESDTPASSSSSFQRDASQQVTTPLVDRAKSIPQSSTPSDEQPQGRLEMNTATEPASASASTVHSPNTTATLGTQVSSIQDLAALASLPPSQIADILRVNPQLREMVLAAVDQVKKTEAST